MLPATNSRAIELTAISSGMGSICGDALHAGADVLRIKRVVVSRPFRCFAAS